MSATAPPQARLSLSIGPESRALLERAAARVDMSLADFVIDVALRQAEWLAGTQEPIVLGAEDWERFQAMRLDPPAPNARLHKALEAHTRVICP